ncbi:hypothetical protein ACMFMG_004191 [Clarireedia jacksonii]
MEPRTKYGVLLIPVSILMLSMLRCGQYISKHTDGFKFRSQGTFDPEKYTCTQSYSVEILSVDPLALYINNFLSNEEIEHLLDLGKDRFRQSLVTSGSQTYTESLNQTLRRSQSAVLPKNDVVCKCLTQRMGSLLGNMQHKEFEPLQIVKYETGGDHYKAHTDWFDEPVYDLSYGSDGPTMASNRLGSIFAYLRDDCERGETYFPNLPNVMESADGDKFALAEGDTGLLVRPKRGNAVFWNNLHANGSGDWRTIHLGLPVESGTKIGLNIWSRHFLNDQIVGGD